MSRGVTVAYSEVHQAFQIALAAHEIGMLDNFFSSLFVAPSKWGGLLSLFTGNQILMNRTNAVPPSKVREYPWPLLIHHTKIGLFGKNYEPWTTINPTFDKWAAKHLERSDSRIVVGSETCARDCFRVGKLKGMLRVLDVPQVESNFLIEHLRRAYDELGIAFSGNIDDREIAERKEEELRLADHILVYSEVHRRSFVQAGIDSQRLVEIPLWADAVLWDRPRNYEVVSSRPLNILFVGGIGIRKGVPWLLEAARQLGDRVRLTLLGPIDKGFDTILEKFAKYYEHVTAQPRPAVAAYYAAADVLVLPSIVDSFGFVAMEAMLSGLPVIVSENCGVPVPDSSWRVPIMNSDAIAERLSAYAEGRALVAEHGKLARGFARAFTPQAYREKIGRFLKSLLND